MNLTFVESPAFERHRSAYLSDEEYGEMQRFLLQKPEAGVVVQGTGGFRKLRWTDSKRNKGKRGGLRIIYYYFDTMRQIYLMMISNKNEATDLTSEQKKSLKNVIDYERKMGDLTNE